MRHCRSVIHYALAVLLALLPTYALSQITIGGHIAPYDYVTQTWLATIPENTFNQDNLLNVRVAGDCSQMIIGQDTILPGTNSQHLFKKICADSAYVATVTNTLGEVITGHIQFTFLPIVRLQGEFGYDYQEGTVTIASPDVTKDNSYTAKVKWRGGTTNVPGKHKRNYKIKFNDDVALFGMRSDNNWMLDAGQPDVFRMRNRIAMDLWNDMARQPYYAYKKPKARNGVSGTMVEVFLDDEYRGIYNFSEFIDRKQLKLKKVDEETGEIHGCLYKGISWDHTQMFKLLDQYDNKLDTLYGYEVKYPDLNDCDTTDWKPLVDINNFIIQCSDHEFETYVSDLFDLDVLVDYSLFAGIVNAVDNSGKNMYWAIYDKAIEQKLTLTPWDLDATFGQRWGTLLTEGNQNHASPEYMTDVDVLVFYRLYKNNVLNFNDQLNERYQQLHQPGGVLSTDSIIGRFTQYYQAITKSGAARRETAKWSGDSDVWGDTIDFDEEYAYICDWIRQHISMIDQTTFPLYYNQDFFDKMESVNQVTMQQDRAIYDLRGRKIASGSNLKRGIYIQNGKKYVVR